jgi:hypothetical protein
LTDYDAVPFFWTTQFDATLNYVGHAKDWDELIVDGDIAKKEFLAYYVKDGRIAAVAGMNRDSELAEFQELMRRDGKLTLDALTDSRQAVSARRQ